MWYKLFFLTANVFKNNHLQGATAHAPPRPERVPPPQTHAQYEGKKQRGKSAHISHTFLTAG